jgi:hypothetical protein
MLAGVARVLHVDEIRLVEAGAYLASAPDPGRPVRPLTRVLPFAELTEERFEDLMTEVMALKFPDGHASRFGGRGHKQDGIDILVVCGSQNVATGQCKRHQAFGPAAVLAAIEEVTVEADAHFLFLSRPTASPGARKEAAKHGPWELWDGEDISRFIRTLPEDQAVRIVDAYFPGHREHFLGIASPGPWLLPEEHFDVIRSALFNHGWTLRGRDDELAALTSSVRSEAASLATVVGPGGAGKTRLLKALAETVREPGTQIRILPVDSAVAAADFELLPNRGRLVVIIDDAHERSDAPAVVAGVWRRHPRAQNVLATRPYGLGRLKEALERASLIPGEPAEVNLADLPQDEAETLAAVSRGVSIWRCKMAT